MSGLPKIIVICGPTASGKSELAVTLAQNYNGAILSADSRQVYKGLDIGSGKVSPLIATRESGCYRYKNILHYGINLIDPDQQYTVTEFQAYTKKVLQSMLANNQLPIICGGSGLWIDAVVQNTQLPIVPPQYALRKDLEELSVPELFAKLQTLDPARAGTIDAANPRRLIRALEIVMTTGLPVPATKKGKASDALHLGLELPMPQLEENIRTRLQARLQIGMVEEVMNLHKSGLTWERLEDLGLEYRYCALYLQQKITQPELEAQLFTAIRQYAKRQLTWFKKNTAIRWIHNTQEAHNAIRQFLKI
jgi:tRNA dimethylallyltransferase